MANYKESRPRQKPKGDKMRSVTINGIRMRVADENLSNSGDPNISQPVDIEKLLKNLHTFPKNPPRKGYPRNH